MSRMGPNLFPFQDDILRQLANGAATAASVSNTIASEGRAPGHGENSPELHRELPRTSTTSSTSGSPSTPVIPRARLSSPRLGRTPPRRCPEVAARCP